MNEIKMKLKEKEHRNLRFVRDCYEKQGHTNISYETVINVLITIRAKEFEFEEDTTVKCYDNPFSF